MLIKRALRAAGLANSEYGPRWMAARPVLDASRGACKSRSGFGFAAFEQAQPLADHFTERSGFGPS
jgi:hypothetical protein